MSRRSSEEIAAFIRDRTAPAKVPLVPEIRLYQATEVTPLWRATAAELEGWDPSPYWAFPWAGGQALARYLLDGGERVRGLRVLDFATGSGLVAIAAALAGAAEVVACDIDPFSAVAVDLNAALNGAALEFRRGDALAEPVAGFDVVLAGDVFYEQPLAGRALRWLAEAASGGAVVLAGDPGRSYSPAEGLELRGAYDVPSAGDVEGHPVLRTRVVRVLPR